MTNPIVPRRFLPIFVALVSCFALWGLLNNMTDNLVPAFQKIFRTSQSTAGYVQVSFYGAYSVIAIFASLLIQKAGYRCGVLVGLGVYVIGALLYVPACIAQSFWLYIVGIFIVAGGCAVLETTCNPYVLALGDESTAVRRLNFAQMFNPVGSLAGILLAQQLILANLHPATADERAGMPPEALDKIVNNELFWVCVPYVGLCAIAAAIWLVFFFSKRTDVDKVSGDRMEIGSVLSILVRSPKWYLGVVAQVFYVGVQIAAWTWMNVYCQKELGVSAKDGATYYLIAIVAFIVCRWIATFAMKYVDPAGLMAVFSAAAVACSLGVMYIPTSVLFSVGGLPFSLNVICLIAMSGCMSLMFPTIYGIALGGIDSKAHKLGAAGLIMAIVGGALLTPWMASIIGDADGLWTKLVPMFSSEWDTNLKLSPMSLRASFIVPVICFAVVLAYALAFRAKKGK
ncbi:MAG: L-fucose:H+ symporter permease [Kiritimatiellae bacterium]|nr:L-fucose:H+ symporter permease [Kiritimatiellia bacterium]MBR3820021.1 L-fucose:H+ symporter permease [Kiritimatiellia bacterium]